jgi:hypothetical protein
MPLKSTADSSLFWLRVSLISPDLSISALHVPLMVRLMSAVPSAAF